MERQESEILVLNSIYGDSVFSAEKNSESAIYSGCYSCHFKLDEHFLITAKNDDGKVSSVEVNHLSPVYLYFTLPAEYPASVKPDFTLTCCWLKPSQLSILRDKLNELASENAGCEILFVWFTFLTDETLKLLEIVSPIDLNIVTKESESFLRKVAHRPELMQNLDVSSTSPAERLQMCETFDINQEAADLLSTPFQCAICLCDRIGRSAAVVKPCRHLFCKTCLSDYFKLKIEEGSVQEITCPAEKCESLTSASLIRSVVDEKLYQRYDALLLKIGLDSIGDLVYCPRPACQYPVIYDKGSSSATCPSCSHAFCIFCRRTYHGVSPCRFRADEIEQLREKYLSADATQKQQLEERYGRLTIKQAIDEYDSNAFLKTNCRQCPSCNAWCQKIEGCNKMACTKCRCYFCWLCNKILNRNNPYGHYSDPEAGCTGRLFEGLTMAVDDDEEEASDFSDDEDDEFEEEDSEDEAE